MDLSIIIPVLNESKKIKNDILAASEFLLSNKISGEIIIIDDGSTDDTTDAAKKIKISKDIPLYVLRYSIHKGKGFAVRKGVKKSIGEYVIFTDSGECVHYDFILRGLELLEKNKCDIAHGSRYFSDSKIIRPHLPSRRVSSAVFRKMFKCALNIPYELTDTQCGFKIYKGDIARFLYESCITDGFMFDIEIILRASKNSYRIKEFPIEWKADLDSRLSQVRMPFSIFFELVKIKRAISKE